MRREAGELRAALPARVLARDRRAAGGRQVETEATIKIWVGGERYVAQRRGQRPVNALDAALREAIGEIYPHLRDIELINFKVRILDETKGTDAVTRVLIDASDGERGVGHDRRLGEPDRGLLGCAGGLAGVRHAAGPTAAASQSRSRPPVSAEEIPLARPVIGEAEERGGARGARARAALARAVPRALRARLRRARRRAARERRLERHRGPAPGAARGRRAARATRSSRARSRSSPPRTRRSTRAPGRCSRTSTR